MNSLAPKIEDFMPFTKTFDCSDKKKVSFSDILNWINNPENTEKIIFDLLIGSKVKNRFDINKQIDDFNISIMNDHNEIRVISLLEYLDFGNQRIRNLSIKIDISPEELKEKYVLYGRCPLYGISTNFSKVNRFDLMIYLLLRPNCFNPKGDENKERPLTGDILIDKVIMEINQYFARKDNSFDRKKVFYKNYDGTLGSLIEYRNRIVSKDRSIDIDLIPNDTKDDLKKVIFSTFFSY